MISIIIPAYNCSCCIERTLDSLLMQTHKEFEIIIINDGSTDNTDAVVRKYIDEHKDIKIVYKATANGGPGSARNHGLAMAQGDYVAFVDSDDVVCPVYLETLYNGITEPVDFCFGSYRRVVDDNVNRPCLMKNELYGIHSAEAVFVSFFGNKTYISLWNAIFSNTIIKNNNLQFVDGCYSGEDVEFIARYLICCKKVKSLKNEIYTFYFDSVRAAKRAEKDLVISLQDSVYWKLADATQRIGWDEGKKALECGKFAVESVLKLIGYAKVCDTYKKFLHNALSVKSDYDYERKLDKRYVKASIYYKARLAIMVFNISPKLFYGLLNKKRIGK